MFTLRGLALFHDAAVSFLAFFLAILLRLGLKGIVLLWPDYILASALFALIVTLVGLGFGINRGVWRYASLAEFASIFKTVSLSIAFFVVTQFLLTRLQDIPRSCVIIAWALTIVFLSAPRAAYRAYRNDRDRRRSEKEPTKPAAKRVLVVGANDNAELFLRTVFERGGAGFEVLAIIDERGRRTGRVIRGVPVLGSEQEIVRIIHRFESQGRRPEAIILARTREDYERHAKLEKLVEIAANQQLELLRLPNLLEMKAISADFDVRPVKLEDLLQRPTIQKGQNELATFVQGRKILITGAGGSIGSELSRQVAALAPAKLVLADASEFLLYSIEQELGPTLPAGGLAAFLCNVRERRAVEELIHRERPEIVFHAAALKHVPIVEAQPLEGILTNVIGTRNLADACISGGVKAMICVSTDKAVNPSNIMGASKRMAEMYCQAMDMKSRGTSTHFVIVRFGNVLGSAGSVVPLFERQIRAGGPVTVTHPEVERYFMTIPEACLLVLQAAAHGLNREEDRGRIFVLDMGKPVKILDLAKNLIRLSGLRPDEDIKIIYPGLRPGEKLYEELFAAREQLGKTGIPGILCAYPRPVDHALITRIFDELNRLLGSRDLSGVLRILKSTVPEYSSADNGIRRSGSDHDANSSSGLS